MKRPAAIANFDVLRTSLRRNRRNLVLAIAAAAAAQLIAIPLPLLVRSMMHRIVAVEKHGAEDIPATTNHILLQFALAMAAVALFQSIFRWQQIVRGERAAQGVLADIRSRMYAHLQRLSQGYFDRKPTGKILIRFVGDATALRAWLSGTVVTVPADVLALLTIAVCIGAIHEQLLVAAAAPIVFLLPVMAWANPRTRDWTRKGRRRQAELFNLLNDRLGALPTIKAMNAQSADHSDIDECLDGFAEANISRATVDAWSRSLSLALATTALAALGLWGAKLYADGTVVHGDLLAAIWLALVARGPVNRLTRANVVHQRARVAAERIAALLSRKTEPGWSDGNREFADPIRSVQLRNISYRGLARRWLFRRVKAEFRGAGLYVVTAKRDRTGAALLELLVRIRRPHKGRIFLNGLDVRRLRVADVRRQIGWVDARRSLVEIGQLWAFDGQDNDGVYVPPFTGGSPATDQVGSDPSGVDRWNARLQAVWALTEGLLPGLDYQRFAAVLQPGSASRAPGRELSHAGRFRVAVAVALLPNPSLLLLEAPTIHLKDEEAERVQRWIVDHSRGCMVVVSTHDERLMAAAHHVVKLRSTRKTDPGRTSAADTTSNVVTRRIPRPVVWGDGRTGNGEIE